MCVCSSQMLVSSHNGCFAEIFPDSKDVNFPEFFPENRRPVFVRIT